MKYEVGLNTKNKPFIYCIYFIFNPFSMYYYVL